MNTRQNPFMLAIQRAGQSGQTRIPFSSRADMEKQIQAQMKSHFIGVMTPYEFQDGEWRLDTEALAIIEKPIGSAPEHAALFKQCAIFFKMLSTVKGPLSVEQIEDLTELMSSVASIIGETKPASGVTHDWQEAAEEMRL